MEIFMGTVQCPNCAHVQGPASINCRSCGAALRTAPALDPAKLVPQFRKTPTRKSDPIPNPMLWLFAVAPIELAICATITFGTRYELEGAYALVTSGIVIFYLWPLTIVRVWCSEKNYSTDLGQLWVFLFGWLGWAIVSSSLSDLPITNISVEKRRDAAQFATITLVVLALLGLYVGYQAELRENVNTEARRRYLMGCDGAT